MDLSYNPLPKANAQLFSACNLLNTLYIDKLLNYKVIHNFFPIMSRLSLTTMTWNCTYMLNVTDILNRQKMYIDFNGKKDFDRFECYMPASRVNQF